MKPSISSVFCELPGTKALLAAAENKKDFEMLEILFVSFVALHPNQQL